MIEGVKTGILQDHQQSLERRVPKMDLELEQRLERQTVPSNYASKSIRMDYGTYSIISGLLRQEVMHGSNINDQYSHSTLIRLRLPDQRHLGRTSESGQKGQISYHADVEDADDTSVRADERRFSAFE